MFGVVLLLVWGLSRNKHPVERRINLKRVVNFWEENKVTSVIVEDESDEDTNALFWNGEFEFFE